MTSTYERSCDMILPPKSTVLGSTSLAAIFGSNAGMEISCSFSSRQVLFPRSALVTSGPFFGADRLPFRAIRRATTSRRRQANVSTFHEINLSFLEFDDLFGAEELVSVILGTCEAILPAFRTLVTKKVCTRPLPFSFTSSGRGSNQVPFPASRSFSAVTLEI